MAINMVILGEIGLKDLCPHERNNSNRRKAVVTAMSIYSNRAREMANVVDVTLNKPSIISDMRATYSASSIGSRTETVICNIFSGRS